MFTLPTGKESSWVSDRARQAFILEIVPSGTKRLVFIFYKKGARKGLDLRNNTTATSIKGGRE